MKRIVSLLVVLACLAGLPAGAEEEGMRGFVRVMGTAPVTEENHTRVRAAAELAALDRAVERTVAEMLPDAVFQKELGNLGPILDADPREFVREFRVLAASENNDYVRVVAMVSPDMGRITAKLSALGISGMDRPLPRVLFLISEQGLEDPEPVRWWRTTEGSLPVTPVESVMARALLDGGFRVVSHSRVPVPAPGENGSMAPESGGLDKREAIRIAKLLDAQVVVIGRSQTRLAANTMGEALRSFRSDVTTIALVVATGEVLAETEASAVALHKEALPGSQIAGKDAADTAGRELAEEMAAAWRRSDAPLPEDTQIRIEIQGKDYLSRFLRFRKTLAAIDGVRDLERREMTARGMILGLRYGGSAEDLAAELLLHSYEGFGISITETGPDHMILSFVPSS